MFEKFNDAATSIGNFAQDAMLKAKGKYNKDKINNWMLIAFDNAYTHAYADDEITIRQRLKHDMEGGEFYFWHGTFTVDDVMNMVKDLSDEQKEDLKANRTAYQENRVKSDWEESFYGSEAPEPAS